MEDLICRDAVLELLYEIKDDNTIPKNYGTILDIIRKIREVSAVSIKEDFVEWVKQREKSAKEEWETYDEKQSFGEMIAYDNVLNYLQAHGILGGE